MTPGLLVSVRDEVEALAAWEGGAAIVDVKEPSRGPLGRADNAVIAGVVRAVDGRLPVSAALGELRNHVELPAGWEALAFVKWGLSGCAGTTWPAVLFHHASRLGSRVVIVAYADADRADAPPVDEVLAFACATPWPSPVLLLDTFDKSRSTDGHRRTLLDCLSLERLAQIVAACRRRDVRIALAGSLGREDVERVATLESDWIGVRGAVCADGDRGGRLDVAAVQALVKLLATPTRGS